MGRARRDDAVTAPVTERIVGSVPKGDDLVVRVRVLEVDGEEFVDIRDYVQSTETYGRGLLVPVDRRKELATLLRSAY